MSYTQPKQSAVMIFRALNTRLVMRRLNHRNSSSGSSGGSADAWFIPPSVSHVFSHVSVSSSSVASRRCLSSTNSQLAITSPAPAAISTDVPSTSKLVAFYASHHVVPLPPDHRFPMEKYAHTLANLQEDASLTDKIELRPGPLAQMKDLLLVHDQEYIDRFERNHMTTLEMRNVGLPWSPELVARTFSSAGGTIEATRLLFEEGRSMTANVSGGTHHAFRARGEGFCVFNDIACAAHVAMRDYGIERILVVDLDVHQGNGTASVFEDEPRVTTFDMFGDKNYPWKSRMRNTHDVPLPDGTEDLHYMDVLRQWLPRLMEQHRPQLILYQAGVDPLKGDSFGRLSLSRAGLLQRNHLVYSTALDAGIPTVITMGGGYTRPMAASIECHTDVFRSAAYRVHAWREAARKLGKTEAAEMKREHGRY